MKLPRRNFLHLAAGAAALSAVSGIAWAQTYPSRPITIVAPFPAGGATDIVSRTLAEGMKAPLGQTFWSRTSPGPAAPSVPAGSCVPNPMAIRWSSANGAAMSAPARSIDCRTTCSTISSRSRSSPLRRYGFLGKNDLPAKDLKELIAWLKANPDKASVATVGAGSASHMCMVYFQDATGTRFQYVPYRGAAPVMQDLIAGQVDLSCLEAGQTLANYRAGKFRVFAV